jgi:hypothetical protein
VHPFEQVANRLHHGVWAIEADCGGGNGNRCRGWEAGLQALADEFGLTITVGPFSPSTSKWNWIEHRLFSAISKKWAGQPLVSYEAILKFIDITTSATGLLCQVSLDRHDYSAKVKVPVRERYQYRLKRHNVLPQWNYTIRPHKKPAKWQLVFGQTLKGTARAAQGNPGCPLWLAFVGAHKSAPTSGRCCRRACSGCMVCAGASRATWRSR